MAESSVHGILVAPRTRTPSLSFPTPAIIENSVSMFRTRSNFEVRRWHAPESSFLLTLHLHQELSLDPARRLTLVLTPRATQRVDLVDENDGWLVFSCQGKQILHQPNGKNEDRISDKKKSSLVFFFCGFVFIVCLAIWPSLFTLSQPLWHQVGGGDGEEGGVVGLSGHSLG